MGSDADELISFLGDLISLATTPPRTRSFDSDDTAILAEEETDSCENVDLSAFYDRVSSLRHHVEAIEPENFPAVHRALLFFVWEMSGAQYTDSVAQSFSTLF